MVVRGPTSKNRLPLADMRYLYQSSDTPKTENVTTNKTSNETTDAEPQPHVSKIKRAKRKGCEKIKKFFKLNKIFPSKNAVSNNQPTAENIGATSTTDNNQETPVQGLVSLDNSQQLKSILKQTSRFEQPITSVLPERETQNMQSALENSSIENLMEFYKENLRNLEDYKLSLVMKIGRKEEPLDWLSLLVPVAQNRPEHTPKTVTEWELVQRRAQYLISHLEMRALGDAPKVAVAAVQRKLDKQLEEAKLRRSQLANSLAAKTEKLEKLQPGLVIAFDPQIYFNNMEKPEKLFATIITGTFTLPFSLKQELLRRHPDEGNDPKSLSDLVFADEKYRLMLAELNYFKFLLHKKCSPYSHEQSSGLKCFSYLVTWGVVPFSEEVQSLHSGALERFRALFRCGFVRHCFRVKRR
ncbi:hypothetical protein ACO0QE_003982 [Hanseniaspora vineae]